MRAATVLPVLGALMAELPLSFPSEASAQEGLPAIPLRTGLEITSSVRIEPGTYRLPASPSLDSAVVVIRGDDVTVDFAGATMEGLDTAADPDLARGVAIRVEGGSNVRIVNANVRGYHIGVLARGTRGFHLADSDLSYNWKPRLYSLVEHESLLDWLSFHDNENDEWLRFGAAIFLDEVTGGEIRGNTVVQGMNALLLNETDSLTVRDNDFSFNSGLGIGMYRSSDNTIVRNRIDFDVRGYSHGFYHRGQDSAGILMYEQCTGNVVAYNSATHGGDGLFVWGGQSTMETGQGGVNDNLFYGNDFSFAPANSMEATFSRNTFVANRAQGSDYGVWGGYSYESRVVGNCFLGNRIGIAIEHGQDNLIASNLFAGDTTAVSLWANPSEPTDWGYPRHRDTRSRDTRVERNLFAGNRVGLRGVRTRDLTVSANRFMGVDSLRVLADTEAVVWVEDNEVVGAPDGLVDECHAVPPLPAEYAVLAPRIEGGTEVPSTPMARRDRSAMIVDEWGPYDWRSPKLWPIDSVRSVPLRLAVLGPPGEWRVVDQAGVAGVTELSGSTVDTISVTPATDAVGDWTITLEYRGETTVSPRGERQPAGARVHFSYGRFEPSIEWETRFFAWTGDPERGPPNLVDLVRAAPLTTRRLPRLDLQGYGSLIEDVPLEYWVLEASGQVMLGPGEYSLRTISDDGIRVWVDGELTIDNWSPHGSELDFAPIEPGQHDVRVEYYQAGGWTELRVEILRGSPRSPRSPGEPEG
jgi:parallel beta-helix repeat protein